jgi:hypothetical protein
MPSQKLKRKTTMTTHQLFRYAGLFLFGPLILLSAFDSHYVCADAELRLYEGANEWDLKDRVMIRSQDGAAFDFQYRKVCTAYNGCKAVQANSDADAKLASLGAKDLEELNGAIGKISDAGGWINVVPAKPSLCEQFGRFIYEVKDSAGKTRKTEEVKACSGSRLSDANAASVERLVNIAVGSAGL